MHLLGDCFDQMSYGQHLLLLSQNLPVNFPDIDAFGSFLPEETCHRFSALSHYLHIYMYACIRNFKRTYIYLIKLLIYKLYNFCGKHLTRKGFPVIKMGYIFLSPHKAQVLNSDCWSVDTGFIKTWQYWTWRLENELW